MIKQKQIGFGVERAFFGTMVFMSFSALISNIYLFLIAFFINILIIANNKCIKRCLLNKNKASILYIIFLLCLFFIYLLDFFIIKLDYYYLIIVVYTIYGIIYTNVFSDTMIEICNDSYEE